MTAFFWKKNSSSDPLLKERVSSNFFLLTILLSINLFFGFIKFANFFSVKFFYFYSAKIVQLSLFGSLTDWIVWGATFCAIVLEILFLVSIEKRLPSRTSLLCLAGISLLLLLLFDSTYVALLGFPITVFIAVILAYFGFGYPPSEDFGLFYCDLGWGLYCSFS